MSSRSCSYNYCRESGARAPSTASALTVHAKSPKALSRAPGTRIEARQDPPQPTMSAAETSASRCCRSLACPEKGRESERERLNLFCFRRLSTMPQYFKILTDLETSFPRTSSCFKTADGHGLTPDKATGNREG